MTKTNNPYTDLIDAIDRAMEYKVLIKVQPMSQDGDVVFTIPLDTFTWGIKSAKNPIIYTHAFTNLFSEIVVRSNISFFNDIIASKHYPIACQKYRHTGFGLKVTKTEICFQMHCSFLVRIFNDFLNKEIEEASKDIPVASEKRALENDVPSITSYSDDKSFRVIVSKHGDLRHAISTATAAILCHHGIRKVVHVTMGMLQMEIEICDESKAENY